MFVPKENTQGLDAFLSSASLCVCVCVSVKYRKYKDIIFDMNGFFFSFLRGAH